MISVRNYGIDLLRLILMYMVCLLHTLGHGGILKLYIAHTANYAIFYFLETISYCAVNGFALISGYTAQNKGRNFSKLVKMWFQVLFYSFVITIILSVLGFSKNMTLLDIIKCAFPVVFSRYWYFTAYFLLFFSTPILNSFIFSIDEMMAKRVLLICIFLFSIISFLTDPFKTEWGYSAMWLMALYCIGALSKKVGLFQKWKSHELICLFLFSNLTTWIPIILWGKMMLLSYISPTILLNGIILVVLFSRLKIRTNRIVKLSSMAFGIYLFQLNPIIWNDILKNAFESFAPLNTFTSLVYTLAAAFGIFTIGLFIEYLRIKIERLLNIQKLSEQITSLCAVLVDKIAAVL